MFSIRTPTAATLDLPLQSLSNPHVLLRTLQQLREDVYHEGEAIFATWRPHIRRREFLMSGLNLAYFLALRRYDLLPLHTALIPWGLAASLSRGETRVLPNLDAVIATLTAVCHTNGSPKQPPLRVFFRGERLLQRQVEAVFGKSQTRRATRILVTLPTQTPYSDTTIHDLISRGMNGVRIDTSKGAPDDWKTLISRVRRAEAETKRTCRVLLDLGNLEPRHWTSDDEALLDFVVSHADLVSVSAIQTARELDILQQEIDTRLSKNSRPLGLMIRIATQQAVENLPELIIHGAGRRPIAILVDWGDLAVEVGYQKLADYEEDVLDVCAAAHIPLVLTSHLLDSFCEVGIPSAADMIDVSLTQEAECLLLHDGPHIAEAVRLLNEVLPYTHLPISGRRQRQARNHI